MRIAMISTHGFVAAKPELGRQNTGGQVVYVLEVAKALVRLGHDVDVLTRRFGDQPSVENVLHKTGLDNLGTGWVGDEVDGVSNKARIFRFPCGGSGLIPKETLCRSIPEWVNNVRDWINEHELQYAFINSHYWDGGLAGQTLSNLLGVPHVHTPHSIGAWKRDNMGGDPDEMERKWNFKHRIREEKVVYDECDALVATTEEQRLLLEAGEYDVPAGKIHVIPPGYDDGRFYPVSLAERERIKSSRRLDLYGRYGRIVLALGRMAENKGYDLLIKAMKTVCSRVDDAYLLLAIGSSMPNEEERRQIEGLKHLATSLGIVSQTTFCDYIPDDELADHYRAADVFALSSRYEPFGMTAVEAMACGTPAVVTTEGGLWRQLEWGRDALYADPSDHEAFGHMIATVLKRPEIYDRLAKHGPRKARAHFTWAGIVEQLLQVTRGLRP